MRMDIKDVFGEQALRAYDLLASRKTHRAFIGAITGFCSSYAPMRLTTALCEDSASFSSLIAASALSFGATILGNTLCENDRWFYKGYLAGQILGHNTFNATYCHDEHTHPSVMGLHQSAIVCSSAGSAAHIAYTMARNKRT